MESAISYSGGNAERETESCTEREKVCVCVCVCVCETERERERRMPATITVYGASWCRHCVAAFTLLEELKAANYQPSFEVEKVDVGDRESDWRNYMLTKLPAEAAVPFKDGSRKITVPQIFIANSAAASASSPLHIGGNSDLQSLHTEGKLSALLLNASA